MTRVLVHFESDVAVLLFQLVIDTSVAFNAVRRLHHHNGNAIVAFGIFHGER